MSKSFLKCSFLTRPLRRKYFQEELNSTEAYSFLFFYFYQHKKRLQAVNYFRKNSILDVRLDSEYAEKVYAKTMEI